MTSVGFAGLGTMGAAMAANLARKGFDVRVWNRTPGKAGDLVALGAAEAADPAELASASEIVVICVSDTPHVEAILFGPRGVAEGAKPGTVVVDCSTISPNGTRAFADRLAAGGVTLVDAPVTGGSEGAQKGTLSILVGGSEADVARVHPVLEAMGTTITHFGPVGAGQVAKAVNQTIIAGGYLSVAEGIVLGMKAGLDPDQLVAALSAGLAGSFILQNRSGRMIANDYPLGFKLALHRKDLGIVLGLAHEIGATLPVASMAAAFEDGLIARGHGDDDNSALARVIRELSGMEG
jgi:3-hydroxyisobutyrate dehydrogenase